MKQKFLRVLHQRIATNTCVAFEAKLNSNIMNKMKGLKGSVLEINGSRQQLLGEQNRTGYLVANKLVALFQINCLKHVLIHSSIERITIPTAQGKFRKKLKLKK